MTAKNKVSFEENIKNLEEIVLRMEEGGLSLEESLDLYEKGIALAKECNRWLNESEQKLTILSEGMRNGENSNDQIICEAIDE